MGPGPCLQRGLYLTGGAMAAPPETARRPASQYLKDVPTWYTARAAT